MTVTDQVRSQPGCWLITGCSSGFGRALASELLASGHKVLATARRVESISDLKAAYPDHCSALALDVNDDGQVKSTVSFAQEQYGAIDVLVNNAGFVFFGGVEATTLEECREVFETNLFGAIRMMQAALPGMRERRRGKIVNIGSISALGSPAGMAFYGATKAALGAISEGLAREVKPLGISVTNVLAGSHATSALVQMSRSAAEIGEYEAVADAGRQFSALLGNEPGDVRLAAQAIISAVNLPKPPVLLPLGRDAVEASFRRADYLVAQTRQFEAVASSTSPQA